MLKLKISRRDVPKLVPFSVVYLYLEDERAAIRAAFPAIFELRPYQLRLDMWAQVHVHTQQSLAVRDLQDHVPDCDAETLRDVLPSLFEADSPWYVAIPTILVLRKPTRINPRQSPLDIEDLEDKSGAGSPGYMGHRDSGNWVQRRAQPPHAEPHVFLDPILAVQGEPDRGVCTTCPRYAHNAAGFCYFGDPVCGEHIRSLNAPTFLQHLAAYLSTSGDHDDISSGEPRLSGTPGGDA